jgi:hypothetical protein
VDPAHPARGSLERAVAPPKASARGLKPSAKRPCAATATGGAGRRRAGWRPPRSPPPRPSETRGRCGRAPPSPSLAVLSILLRLALQARVRWATLFEGAARRRTQLQRDIEILDAAAMPAGRAPNSTRRSAAAGTRAARTADAGSGRACEQGSPPNCGATAPAPR